MTSTGRAAMLVGAATLLGNGPIEPAAAAGPAALATRTVAVAHKAPDPSIDEEPAADDDGDLSRTVGPGARGARRADAPPAGSDPRRDSGGTYTIRAGDTLWNVSQSVMRDPRGWPKLWAMNPGISNPHWIYPGQVVRLRDGEGLVEDGDDDDEGAGRANPAGSVSLGTEPRAITRTREAARAGRARAEIVPVRQLAFVDEGQLHAAGTLNGSIEEKIMLATGDQAYVEFPAGQVPHGGGRYSLYEVDGEHPLRSPGSSAILGYLVHVFGEVVIDEVADGNIASGHLVGLVGPVERGCRVGPVIPQVRAVAPRPNKIQVTARIVAAVDPSSFIANQMFVILDRGRRHGVEAGNRFLVLRQGDGLKRILESWDETDPRFPPYAAAEIVAVDVGNETTVGWISRGSRELHVGDVADLRRGY